MKQASIQPMPCNLSDVVTGKYYLWMEHTEPIIWKILARIETKDHFSINQSLSSKVSSFQFNSFISLFFLRAKLSWFPLAIELLRVFENETD